MIFDKTVKSISRIGEMINILLRFGFDDVIATTALKKFLPAKKQLTGYGTSEDESPYEYTRWERIRMVVEELGTTFIKLAQLLSNRPDILPDPLIQEFAKLQSNVPPFSTKTAVEIIEQELGKPINELFTYFDNRTIGAGSIGQVHRARLTRGEDVVVKVRRPDAEHKVRTDLRLMREFFKLTETYFYNLGILNPLEIIDAFEESIRKELDYRNEALNSLRFRRIYAQESDFYIPKPYPELSTQKVLVVEFTHGCQIDNLQQLRDWGISSEKIAEKITDIYLKQIFEFGHFHADPHAGNIFIKPDKQVVLIDFGMTGKLSKQQKYDFANVALSIAQKNPKALASGLRRLATNGEVENMKIFESDLEALIDDYTTLSIDETGVSVLIGRLRRIAFEYKLRIPGSVFVIFRALAILEGIGRKLHPDYKMMEFLIPYGRKIVAEQYAPGNVRNELSYSVSQFMSLLYSSPLDIKYILKKMRKGEFVSTSKIDGLEPAIKQINTSTNRLAAALIIAATLMTSGIVVLAAPPEMLYFLGIPLLSAVGFGAAGLLGLWLIVYTIRHRKK